MVFYPRLNWLLYFSDFWVIYYGILLSTDVTYHLAKAYQSCTSACEEVNRTCAETGHGFPPDDARFMFSLLGLSCVFTGNLDDYTHASDPLYKEQEDGKISCRGFKNIPAKLRCGATAKFSTIRRICPCKGTLAPLVLTYNIHTTT